MTAIFEDAKAVITGSCTTFGRFTWTYMATENSLIVDEQYHDKNFQCTVPHDRVHPISGYYKYDYDDDWETYLNKFGKLLKKRKLQ